MGRPEAILELARSEGFDLAGLAPLEPPRDAPRFEAWLEAGHHGSMAWLERQRERIVDPRRVAPGARTLLVVGLGHARAAGELPGGGRVARYALGRDYHNLIGKRLRRLARRLEEAGLARTVRRVVDAGPLLERSHAEAAGLGFGSRAANLLHPRFGPWFFLGELLLEEELEPTAPGPPTGSCGTCTACLDACPTGALLAPGLLDAPLCLSYQTIEQRGPIPRELREPLGDWLFGCDVCSEVCPWGREAPDASSTFGSHPGLESGALALLAGEGDRAGRAAALAGRLEGSPLRRPGREGLARNAALVLGNRPDDAGREALLRALDQDPAPLVREAAAWGLARGHGRDAGVRAALERALGREERADLRAAMGRNLDEFP